MRSSHTPYSVLRNPKSTLPHSFHISSIIINHHQSFLFPPALSPSPSLSVPPFLYHPPLFFLTSLLHINMTSTSTSTNPPPKATTTTTTSKLPPQACLCLKPRAEGRDVGGRRKAWDIEIGFGSVVGVGGELVGSGSEGRMKLNEMR